MSIEDGRVLIYKYTSITRAEKPLGAVLILR
jgi:hypothetical protein